MCGCPQGLGGELYVVCPMGGELYVQCKIAIKRLLLPASRHLVRGQLSQTEPDHQD